MKSRSELGAVTTSGSSSTSPSCRMNGMCQLARDCFEMVWRSLIRETNNECRKYEVARLHCWRLDCPAALRVRLFSFLVLLASNACLAFEESASSLTARPEKRLPNDRHPDRLRQPQNRLRALGGRRKALITSIQASTRFSLPDLLDLAHPSSVCSTPVQQHAYPLPALPQSY